MKGERELDTEQRVQVREPAALGGPPGGRLGRGACACGRGGRRPIRAGVREGAGLASSGSASPPLLHTHEYKEPYDLRVSFFHFFFSFILRVFSDFFKNRDLWQCWGEETVAKGNLLFSPFPFLSLFLFLFPGQGLKIYQVEKQDGRVQPFPDKFTENFFFFFAITF